MDVVDAGICQASNLSSMSGKVTKAPPAGWRRFSGTLSMGAFGILVASYYWLFHATNSVPVESDLVRMNIEVLTVRDPAPHLVVRLDDGSKMTMEFPIGEPIIGGRAQGGAYYALKEYERAQLTGCRGFVAGVPLQYSIDRRFRICLIDCGAVQKSFDFFVNRWNKYEVGGSLLFVKLIAFLYFIVTMIIFWIEGRKK